MRIWSRIWDNICKNWFLAGEPETGQKQIDDLAEIQTAVEEMATARSIYSEVNDPELVDWAVYSLTAAEKRYDYLLKKYRQKK
ncbi:MAG: DUF2508 family protein [Syntrophomonadaceae bacterium]|nr:DUF2508 family protein [Syntrophomonadaceae bacterium]